MRLRPLVTTTTLAAALTTSGLAGVSAPASATARPAATTKATQKAGVSAPAGMTSRLSAATRSGHLASGFSGLVIDEATGTPLWSSNSSTARMPASTQKVVTAFTVLHSTSPQTQLVTRSFQSRAVPGNVYLTGAGDPSLTSSKLSLLADRTAAALRAQGRTSVTVYADASIFPAPTNAAGWKSSYISGGEVQPVRGLTLAGYRGSNGATAAATVFADRLAKGGVTARFGGTATTPKAANQLSASWSAPVGSLVGAMLSRSDNDYAEYLLRLAAAESGLRPTWANALAHQRAVLTAAGIPTSGYVNRDGSGLSRSNRMPVATLASTVDHLWGDPATRSVAFAWGAMPRSGQTGTLRSRYTVPAQRCAVGKVLAKTGTLGDAVALAGVAQGADGRTRVFAFISNGKTKTGAVRQAVDGMATAVVGCH